MTATIIEGARKRWRINPKNILADFIAAFTVGVASIPDSMASALLAGINPLAGLYTMMIATPIGALFTSSEMMHISTTSALSLGVASSLTGMSPADKLQAVYMLALMVGVIQILLGLLKMGFLVRFVPHSVMTGFLNGVALLIILGQLRDFTGFQSQYSNRVVQAVDTALNAQEIVLPILIVGLTTVLLIIGLDRIKATRQFSFILAMVFASLLPFLPWFQNVPLVGDVTQVPSALPSFALPNFSLVFQLIVPAFALSVIGLVQGAGISQGYPNPDGKFPDPSGDFVGQGAANLATSFFKGMPCGGSLSGTAMVVERRGQIALGQLPGRGADCHHCASVRQPGRADRHACPGRPADRDRFPHAEFRRHSHRLADRYDPAGGDGDHLRGDFGHAAAVCRAAGCGAFDPAIHLPPGQPAGAGRAGPIQRQPPARRAACAEDAFRSPGNRSVPVRKPVLRCCQDL